MRCPSGSAVATYLAAIAPPAPSRFSTITGWPRLTDSFSASKRAMVSDALPGETPETRRMVLLGNPWAATPAANSNETRTTQNLLMAPPPGRTAPRPGAKRVGGSALLSIRHLPKCLGRSPQAQAARESSARKQQAQLEAQRPVGAAVGPLDVVVVAG